MYIRVVLQNEFFKASRTFDDILILISPFFFYKRSYYVIANVKLLFVLINHVWCLKLEMKCHSPVFYIVAVQMSWSCCITASYSCHICLLILPLFMHHVYQSWESLSTYLYDLERLFHQHTLKVVYMYIKKVLRKKI